MLSSFCCWLPSMRWLLCGHDGSKKTKMTSVITEKYPAREFFSITDLYQFEKIKNRIILQSLQFCIYSKIKSAPRQICNHFDRDGIRFRRTNALRARNGTLQCNAGLERHGCYGINDTMASAWAPAAGHTIGSRWVPRSNISNYSKWSLSLELQSRQMRGDTSPWPGAPATTSRGQCHGCDSQQGVGLYCGKLCFASCTVSSGSCTWGDTSPVTRLHQRRRHSAELTGHLPHPVPLAQRQRRSASLGANGFLEANSRRWKATNSFVVGFSFLLTNSFSSRTAYSSTRFAM